VGRPYIRLFGPLSGGPEVLFPEPTLLKRPETAMSGRLVANVAGVPVCEPGKPDLTAPSRANPNGPPGSLARSVRDLRDAAPPT